MPSKVAGSVGGTQGQHDNHDSDQELAECWSGGEGHSYVTHILNSYASLAVYTVFAQGGGIHNGVHVDEAVHAFLARNNTTSPLTPVVPSNKRGWILYRDADAHDPESMSNQLDSSTNFHIFPYHSHLDMANRARALYSSLFGGSACDAPPMVFMAGAQFIVRRDAIHARAKTFWEFLRQKMSECFVLGWDLERLWLHVFNASIHAAPQLSFPGYCTGHATWKNWNCTRYKEQIGFLEI